MARQLVFRDLGGNAVTVTTAYMKSRRAVYAVFSVGGRKVELWMDPVTAVDAAAVLLDAAMARETGEIPEPDNDGLSRTSFEFVMPHEHRLTGKIEIIFIPWNGNDAYHIRVHRGERSCVEMLTSYKHVVRIANALLDAAVYGWEP